MNVRVRRIFSACLLAFILFGLIENFLPFEVGEVYANPDTGWTLATDVFVGSEDDDCLDYLHANYVTAWSAEIAAGINTYQYIGQRLSGIYSIYRYYCFFDTSSIPDANTIISVDLSINWHTNYSTTDFQIVVQSGQPTYPHIPVVLADYDKDHYNSGHGGSLSSSEYVQDQYSNLTFWLDGLAFINKTGTTKLCLRSEEDRILSVPSGDEYVRIYNCSSAYPVRLYVTHGSYESPTNNEPSTYALSFDGQDDYVSLPDHSDLHWETGDFTVLLWYRVLSGTDTSSDPILFSKHDYDWNNYFFIYFRFSGELGFLLGDIGGEEEIRFRYDSRDSYWNFLVAIRESGVMSLYWNNFLVGTETNTRNLTCSDNINIGGDIIDDAYYLNGTIDEVQIYNRALDSSELTQLYNSGLGTYNVIDTSELVGLWKIYEGSGSTIYDRSGENHHGTVNGASWETGICVDWYPMSSLNIQTDYNTTLTSASYTTNQLTFNISASAGVTSTTEVYCGSHGEPTSVSGATSWSYNGASQVATVRVLHQSTETVSLRWTDYERTRNVIVSRGLIAISLVSVSFVLIVAFGIIMFTSGQAGGEDFVTVILTFGVFLVVAFLMAVIIGNFTGI